MVKVVGEMKKRLQRRGARKGFTLVELLIVIIIIGILAGAMMMVAGRSRDSAEAAKIISDLRSVKAAALIWMTENPSGLPETAWTNFNDDPTPLNPYLDKPLSASDPYIFAAGEVTVNVTRYVDDDNDPDTDPVPDTQEQTSDVWLLGYDVTNIRSGVKENLESQAKSVGLYGGIESDQGITIDLADPANAPFYDNEDNAVYIIVQ
jgi:prepilin-type N-terminal cleavage/methylation domain-containing protein